jgi:hypothetical protein
MTEHAAQILPYRGLGSGIPRALREWPRIELIDYVAGNQFSALAWRPESEWVPVTGVVTPEVTPEAARLLEAVQGEITRSEIQAALGLKDEKHFRDAYLRPALDGALIEMTIPDKPRSPLQKYRLTAQGRALQDAARKND